MEAFRPTRKNMQTIDIVITDEPAVRTSRTSYSVN